MGAEVIFWLLPAEADRQVFEGIINELARKYDAPVFAPHVTLYSGDYADHEDPGAILAQAIQDVHAIELTVDSIRCTSEYTKTVFVQFIPSEQITGLSDRIRRLSENPSGYRLDPHLSLLYKHMTDIDRQRAVGTVSLPRRQVSFDAVAGIVSPGSTRSPGDVERWKTRWRMALPKQS